MFGIDGIHDGMQAISAVLDHLDHSDEHRQFDFTNFHPFSPWDQHGRGSEDSHDHVDHTSSHHVQPTEFGHPHGDGFTHQTTAYTCAVASQKMILDQFHVVDRQTGHPLSEAHLVYDAAAHGWLTEHGTSMADLGRLLEFYGVGCHEGSGWHDLVQELADGHQIIIAVDAHELWKKGGELHALGELLHHHPNHALVLKGVKIDSKGHASVVVNDPGQQHGAGVEYPIEHFQQALDGKYFHFLATDHSPPGWDAKSLPTSLFHNDPALRHGVHRQPTSHNTFSRLIENMDAKLLRDFIRAL